MEKRKLLSITRAILTQPTAPFHERAVADEICRLLARCPHVTVRRDAFGNLIARYRRGGRGISARSTSRPRYAFAAHMDHPGWVGGEFLGGVPAELLRTGRGRTREFDGFAMWDFPPLHLRSDGLLYSRACDDLIGCAVLVAIFHELEKMKTPGACLGIFSRAEEVGFVGAIKLAQSGLLPRSVTVISLETSAERPPAKMGAGPIIRVGDKTSVFDSAATAALTAIALREKIPVQRCLMSGGTCEATAYALYGYRTAALCIALGNYHNCDMKRKRIAPEFVSFADVAGFVRVCTQIAADRHPPADSESALRKRLEANLAKYERYFASSSDPGSAARAAFSAASFVARVSTSRSTTSPP